MDKAPVERPNTIAGLRAIGCQTIRKHYAVGYHRLTEKLIGIGHDVRGIEQMVAR